MVKICTAVKMILLPFHFEVRNSINFTKFIFLFTPAPSSGKIHPR